MKNRSKFSALRPHYERGRKERTWWVDKAAGAAAAAMAEKKKVQNTHEVCQSHGNVISRHSRRMQNLLAAPW